MRFSFDSKRKMVKIFDTIANKEIAAIPTVAIDCYIEEWCNGNTRHSKCWASEAKDGGSNPSSSAIKFKGCLDA